MLVIFCSDFIPSLGERLVNNNCLLHLLHLVVEHIRIPRYIPHWSHPCLPTITPFSLTCTPFALTPLLSPWPHLFHLDPITFSLTPSYCPWSHLFLLDRTSFFLILPLYLCVSLPPAVGPGIFTTDECGIFNVCTHLGGCQGMKPKVFGLEFRSSNHWASYVPGHKGYMVKPSVCLFVCFIA